jgi:aspartate/methionine/tyrosine aminotransferase
MGAITDAGPMPAPGSMTTPRLLWVNSPANPSGQVLGVEQLAKVVGWARDHGVVVASDECYAELDWRDEDVAPEAGEVGLQRPGAVPSILDPQVCDGSHEGLLAVYSLSKQSNMAGYRAAFVAGDPALIGRLLEIRKHAGMMVPLPVQQAMIAALSDDTHVAQQRARYGRRRGQVRVALETAGYRIEHSEAGLYLWTTRDGLDTDRHGLGTDAGAAADPDRPIPAHWPLVSELADLGILVAPGSFYGAAGGQHMRISLTASDERIKTAAERLTLRGQSR